AQSVVEWPRQCLRDRHFLEPGRDDFLYAACDGGNRTGIFKQKFERNGLRSIISCKGFFQQFSVSFRLRSLPALAQFLPPGSRICSPEFAKTGSRKPIFRKNDSCI